MAERKRKFKNRDIVKSLIVLIILIVVIVILAHNVVGDILRKNAAKNSDVDGVVTTKIFNNQQIDVSPDLTSGVMIDASSGQVLWESHYLKSTSVASISKILSVYVVADKIKAGKMSLNEKIKISKNVSNISKLKDATNVYLKEGESYKVSDLLNASIMESANGAISALAEGASGSQKNFVHDMESTAKKLGMHDVKIVNPSGLPTTMAPELKIKGVRQDTKENMMSPRDVAVVSQKLINNYPKVLKISSTKETTFPGGQRVVNTDQMLPGERYQPSGYKIDGLKTGTGESSGYCFVATGIIDRRRIISVALGASSNQDRFTETNKIWEALKDQMNPTTYKNSNGSWQQENASYKDKNSRSVWKFKDKSKRDEDPNADSLKFAQ